MKDTFEFTLNNPLTEEQWDMINDADFDITDRITFHTKHGKEVEFTKVIRCKDCKHFVLQRGWRYIGEPEYMHCDMFKDSHSPWAGSDYEPSEEDYCSRAEPRGEE